MALAALGIQPVTAFTERPLYFAAGDETLFGVATEPKSAAGEVGLLAITGGGWIPGSHRNGMWVRLARRVADHGFRSVRFDFHGVGESTGTTTRFLLHEPYTIDALAAAEMLRQLGSEPIVFVGTCFGGRTAADAACGALVAGSRPAGVALLAVPILEPGQSKTAPSVVPVRRLVGRASKRELILKLASAQHRKVYADFVKRRIMRPFRRRRRLAGDEGSRYVRNLTALVDAAVPILMLFGDRDDQYAQYLEARSGRLANLFEKAGDLIEVKTVPGELHGFTSLDAQSVAIGAVEQWMTGHFGAQVPR